MWPQRQKKRHSPEILITGLTGTGKTLVARTLLRWGFDMGPWQELWVQSLEHPMVSKAAKKICSYYDSNVNPGYVINPAWSSTSTDPFLSAPLRDERGRGRLALPEFYPQVVKVPYVAALPTLLIAMGQMPPLIIWCSRDFPVWEQVVTETDFFLEKRTEEAARWEVGNPKKRGEEPVSPNLRDVWLAQDEVLTWLVALARKVPYVVRPRVIHFNVDTISYGGVRDEPAHSKVFGMTHLQLTERTKEEASGRGDHLRARAHRVRKAIREGRPALRRDDFGRHSPAQAGPAAGAGSPGVFRFGGDGVPPKGE